jgi:hypothetical protein
MKRIRTILKVITFLIALGSFVINLHKPFEYWIWQLIVMFWVSVCFLKTKRIEELEIENKFRKKI